MTYQYARLAVGRLPRFRGAYEIVLYTEDGKPLPIMTEDEKFYKYACNQIADYWIAEEAMHCKLKGVF